jgi:uncharacterized repeat protein (TIGR03803 family)
MKSSLRSLRTPSTFCDSLHHQLGMCALVASVARVGILALPRTAEAKILRPESFSRPGGRGLRCALLALCLMLVTADASATSKFKVLYSFKDTPDGSMPVAAVAFDGSGNLYGTTQQGGLDHDGTVFELSPGPGEWSESVLHSFSDGDDGAYPDGGLFVDTSGNLYGTTSLGGSGQCSVTCGTVFEMSPTGNGGWAESMLHNFNGTDGANPTANLIVGKDGAFYGTTQAGGAHGEGTVFRLVKEPDGTWSETVVYSFTGQGVDGAAPMAGLLRGSSGNLYGTTYVGGAYKKGTVFEVSRGSKGKWTERLLHSFGRQDGSYPQAEGLTMDAAGNLYGVCPNGGPDGNGSVFRLAHRPHGRWALTILYDFPRHKDGWGPVGTLVWDAKGNLYGVTAAGGNTTCEDGCGTVFKLSRRASGKWRYGVVYRLDVQDGEQPVAGLIWDAKGNLYGTAIYGGEHGSGTVFEVTP